MDVVAIPDQVRAELSPFIDTIKNEADKGLTRHQRADYRPLAESEINSLVGCLALGCIVYTCNPGDVLAITTAFNATPKGYGFTGAIQVRKSRPYKYGEQYRLHLLK